MQEKTSYNLNYHETGITNCRIHLFDPFTE